LSAFDRLIDIVPPPECPFDAGDEECFRSVEAMLRFKLPTDFRRLIRIYGTGQWLGFWNLLNPNTSNLHVNLIAQSQCLRPKGWSTLDSERFLRENLGDQYPHAIYPESGGILPWATTDNGGRFYWLTKGEADCWPTIYYPDRAPDYREYNMTSTELLYAAVSGSVPIFAEEFGPDFQYGRADSFVPQKY
jgi:hypothetical protein